MKNVKFYTVSFLLLILCLSPSAVFAKNYQAKDVLLKLNGAYLIYSSSLMPYIDENSRTLVPLRIISDSLNGTITWNNQEKIVEMKSKDLQISAKLNGHNVTINGHEMEVDTSIILNNGTVMVPIKWVANGLGATFSYNPKYNLVSLDHPNFFEKGKLELMNDEYRVDRTTEVQIIPQKISYKYHTEYRLDFLNISIINASDQKYSKDQIQDHIFAPIYNNKDYVNSGSRGDTLNEQSDLRLSESITPYENLTYELPIGGRLDKNLLQTGQPAEYAFIRYYKRL